MFFWQERDIVTVLLQLLATWPAGAVSLYNSVPRWAAVGPVVETSVCGGGLDSHCETNTLKLHQKCIKPLFKVINMVSSPFKSQTSAYTCAVLLLARACRHSDKTNSKPKFFWIFFVVVFLFWMNMPCKMFGDATTECSIFTATAPAASICSNYRKQSGENLQLYETGSEKVLLEPLSKSLLCSSPLLTKNWFSAWF